MAAAEVPVSDPQGAASDTTASELLPKPSDVRGAAERLAGHAVETPLLRADALDELIGGRLLLKAEPLQRTGSFKFRGACNRLLQLDPAAKARGVVTYSSGNHAQAVAAAAKARRRAGGHRHAEGRARGEDRRHPSPRRRDRALRPRLRGAGGPRQADRGGTRRDAGQAL